MHVCVLHVNLRGNYTARVKCEGQHRQRFGTVCKEETALCLDLSQHALHYLKGLGRIPERAIQSGQAAVQPKSEAVTSKKSSSASA